jgi:hypothetical protein
MQYASLYLSSPGKIFHYQFTTLQATEAFLHLKNWLQQRHRDKRDVNYLVLENVDGLATCQEVCRPLQ